MRDSQHAHGLEAQAELLAPVGGADVEPRELAHALEAVADRVAVREEALRGAGDVAVGVEERLDRRRRDRSRTARRRRPAARPSRRRSAAARPGPRTSPTAAGGRRPSPRRRAPGARRRPRRRWRRAAPRCAARCRSAESGHGRLRPTVKVCPLSPACSSRAHALGGALGDVLRRVGEQHDDLVAGQLVALGERGDALRSSRRARRARRARAPARDARPPRRRGACARTTRMLAPPARSTPIAAGGLEHRGAVAELAREQRAAGRPPRPRLMRARARAGARPRRRRAS